MSDIMALSGDELDYAVAIADKLLDNPLDKDMLRYVKEKYHPSTNGSQCIEIMEREKISVTPSEHENGDSWESEKVISSLKYYSDIFIHATGKTPNEAILRCFLLSKL